jgi:hypothetical protein
MAVVGQEREANQGQWGFLTTLYGVASYDFDLGGSAAVAEGGQGARASLLNGLGGDCCWRRGGGAAGKMASVYPFFW